MATTNDGHPIPTARCGSGGCTSMLTFRKDFSGAWVCGCDSCEDGEYDERGCHRTDPVGYGRTPVEALEYYANVALDIDPAELIVDECHV